MRVKHPTGGNGWLHFGRRWMLGVMIYRGRLVWSAKLRPWREGKDRRFRFWRLEVAL